MATPATNQIQNKVLTQGQTYDGGTVKYDRDTGKPLVSGQTTNSVAGFTPPSNVITTASLQPQPVVNIPQQNFPIQPPQAPTTNLAETALKQFDLSQNEKGAQDAQSNLIAKQLQAITGLQGQDQALADAQNIAGVGQKKQELQTLNSQILQKQAEIAQDDTQLVSQMRQAERHDTLLPFAQADQNKLAGDAAIMRALKSSEIGVLNAQALAKQGDIALAQDEAKQAVDLKYAPYRDAIEIGKAQLDAIKPFLDAAEKKQAAAMQVKANLAMKEIDKVSDFQKDALNNALLNGAPQSVINKINSAGSVDEITKIGGQYIVSEADRLDLELKRANIQNVYSTIAERNAEAIKTKNLTSFVTPPLFNPVTGKPDPLAQLASVIKATGAKDNTNLQNILGVVSATQQLAENNKEGQFPAIAFGDPTGAIQRFAGPKGQSNLSGIEAINLKVQQWASGAALTEAQTKQVEKITPRNGDTNQQIRNKSNALANFMQEQASGLLASQGINYKPQSIDYYQDLSSVSNSDLLSAIPGVAQANNKKFFEK